MKESGYSLIRAKVVVSSRQWGPNLMKSNIKKYVSKECATCSGFIGCNQDDGLAVSCVNPTQCPGLDQPPKASSEDFLDFHPRLEVGYPVDSVCASCVYNNLCPDTSIRSCTRGSQPCTVRGTLTIEEYVESDLRELDRAVAIELGIDIESGSLF